MAILITLRLSDGLQDFKEFGVSITEQKKKKKHQDNYPRHQITSQI